MSTFSRIILNETCASGCIEEARNRHGQYSHKEVSEALTKGWEYSPKIMEAEIMRMKEQIQLIEDYRPKKAGVE